MNLLAHLLLADRHGLSFPGTLLGDFVKGDLAGRFDSATRRGIQLHRRTDRFTDDHPVFHRSRRRIAPNRRRYAGVFIDVFYDHFVSLHWARFTTEDRTDFIHRVYGNVEEFFREQESRPASTEDHAQAPIRMARLIRFMIDHDLLGSYLTLDGIDDAMRRLARRVRRPEGFAEAGDDLRDHFHDLEKDFLEFFPDLERFTADQNDLF